MNTHYYKYFEEAARECNFTKAAENLHMSQQSLSEHIKRMEEHYGVLFFKRKPSIQLTHAGELFLEYISQSLYREEQLLAEFSYIRSQQKGRIRVGITPTRAPIFFPRIFSRFNRLHPLVELSLREDHTAYLIKDLMDGRVDFVIGLEETGIANNRLITCKTLLQDRKLYFVATRELLAQYIIDDRQMETAVKKGITLDKISAIPIILKPDTSKIHSQMAQEYLKLKAKPKIVVESSNVLSMMPLCSAGNVGMFMSQTILRYAKNYYAGHFDNVLALPLQGIHINCDIALMHLCNKPLTVHFNDFIEAISGVFEEYAETR